MNEALIGFAGIILGLLLSEYYRRQNRIEFYSHDIFQKRLKIYERFYTMIVEIQDLGIYSDDLVVSYNKVNPTNLLEWQSKTSEIAKYIDNNALYLNDNISFHCMASMFEVHDIFKSSDYDYVKLKTKVFRTNMKKLVEMIKEETGLQKMNKLFSSITKARHKSEIISYHQEANKKAQKIDKQYT